MALARAKAVRTETSDKRAFIVRSIRQAEAVVNPGSTVRVVEEAAVVTLTVFSYIQVVAAMINNRAMA